MIGYEQHPFFRCRVCGSLTDDDLIGQGAHAGHSLRPVSYGTLSEYIWIEHRKFKKHGNGFFIVWLIKNYIELRKKLNEYKWT